MSDLMTLRPIGQIDRSDESVWLSIDPAYRTGLAELDRFSHVLVVWWASEHDDEESRSITQTDLPYAPGETAGVFACRSEYRPNPVAITTCELVEVDLDEGRVVVSDIDAYGGSPLIDIKPYIGVVDRVREVRVPEWYDGWPEWLPDGGIGLFED